MIDTVERQRMEATSASTAVAIDRPEWIGALLIGLFFLFPLLVYGPWDNEEVGLGIFASQLHYRALLNGQWLLWLHDLGFGTPLPIGQRLDLHPVFLFAGLPLRALMSLLWAVHVLVMVVYVMRLAAVFGIRPPLRLIVLGLYVFSAVSVCLFYQTDWVTGIIGWTLFPALIFYVREAVYGGAATRFWLHATRIALLFGFLVLNSHPGYLVPLFAALAVYIVVAVGLRVRVVLCLTAAALMSAGMAAERLYFFVSESQLFPAELPRVVQAGYVPVQYVAAAIAPIAPVRDDLRLPFIGLVAGVAVLGAALTAWGPRNRDLRACAWASVAVAAVSLLPQQLSLGASGMWLFRDPMVAFGLLAGGQVLQRGLDAPAAWLRRATWGLIVFQVLQQGATVYPGFYEFGRHIDDLLFYRYQEQRVGLAKLFADAADTYGRRVYLSAIPLRLSRGGLARYGFHFTTDLVFLGVHPVNGWFKNVSMDRIYPSVSSMHGYIGGERDVIENGTLLDVLGINMVVTAAEEGPVPDGLREVGRMAVERFMSEFNLLLLVNADAWPEAVLLSPDAARLTLPTRAGCSNAAALCLDYQPLAGMRLPAQVSSSYSNGRYRLSMPPSPEQRLVFLSATYRPEWRANSPAGALDVVPVAGAFVGVVVPPGVDTVDVAFVPRSRIVLTWVSAASVLAVLGVFVALGRRGWSSRR